MAERKNVGWWPIKKLPAIPRREELTLIQQHLERRGVTLCPGALTAEFSTVPDLVRNPRTGRYGRR